MASHSLEFHAAVLGLRLSVDEPCPYPAAVYVPGLSEGMVRSHHIVETVKGILSQWPKAVLAYNGCDGRGNSDTPGSAWPGANWYQEIFADAGVSIKRQVPTAPGAHTRGEADALIHLARERKWQRVAVVTVCYHKVRILSCLVAAMHVAGHEVGVHFSNSAYVEWRAPIKGSQGIEDTTSARELSSEVERIIAYWERGMNNGWRNGYGAPPKLVYRYLDETRPRLG